MSLDIINSTVAGIPCQIQIDHYYHQEGYKKSPWQCSCDSEYYGETEIEFTVLYRNGRHAPRLEKKIDEGTPLYMKSKERERIEREIIEYMSEPNI